jgi:hypothetical protein
VYFSDTTRNFYSKEFIASYRGVLLLMLRNHIQFRIVTPRSVSSFQGKMLVLPDLRIISEAESRSIHAFSEQGGSLVMTGHPDAKLSDLTKAKLYPDAPERAYLQSAEANFEGADDAGVAALLSDVRVAEAVEVDASRNVVAHVATIGDRRFVFLANFDGLKAGEVATPRVQRNIEIKLSAAPGAQLHVLPFLGKETMVSGEADGSRTRFKLPAVDRGAVAWID